MRTSYGLEFNTVKEINPEWSDYDKTIAECHLANTGVVIVDTEHGQPIDNEYDLEEIYRLLEKENKKDAARVIRSPFQLLDELCLLEPGSTIHCTCLHGKDMDNPLTLKEKNCRIGDCPTFVLAHNDGRTVRVDGEQIMEGSCRFGLPGWKTPPAGQLRYVNRTYPDGIPVRLEVFSYDSPGNLYVGLLSPENDNETSWGPFTDVTVNMRPLPPYYAFVKEYSENEGMGEFLTRNGIACRSHVIPDIHSGFVTMHAYVRQGTARAARAGHFSRLREKPCGRMTPTTMEEKQENKGIRVRLSHIRHEE